jgi:hypothetical protein
MDAGLAAVLAALITAAAAIYVAHQRRHDFRPEKPPKTADPGFQVTGQREEPSARQFFRKWGTVLWGAGGGAFFLILGIVGSGHIVIVAVEPAFILCEGFGVILILGAFIHLLIPANSSFWTKWE